MPSHPRDHPEVVELRTGVNPAGRAPADLAEALAAELEALLATAPTGHFVRQISISCDKIRKDWPRPKGSRYVIRTYLWPDPGPRPRASGGQP